MTPVLTSSEADKIADALLFKNSAKVTGTIPTVINTSLAKDKLKGHYFPYGRCENSSSAFPTLRGKLFPESL